MNLSFKTELLLPSTIMLYVVLNLLSYPFVPIKYIYHEVFQVVSLIVIVIAILLALTVPGQKIHFKSHRYIGFASITSTFISLYVIYLCVLGVSSILSTHSSDSIYIYNKMLIRFICAWSILVFIPKQWFVLFLNSYTKLILVLSVMAIVLQILLLNKLIDPLFTIHMPTSSYFIDDGQRKFYYLGLSWRQNIIVDAFGIYTRLQSFADEPGTFAFVMVPAIINSYFKKKYIALVILLMAFIMTLSLGAITSMIILSLLLVLYRVIFAKKITYSTGKNISLFVTIIAITFLLIQYSSDSKYIRAYYQTKMPQQFNSSQGTSLGARISGVVKIKELILAKPWGAGAGAKISYEFKADIGWLNALVESGIVGGIIYYTAFLLLAIIAFHGYQNDDNLEMKVYSYSFLINCFAALQRTPVDGSIWHYFIIIAVIRLSPLNHGSLKKQVR